MHEWNEAKREANLKKHGYDFADADLVYESPDKIRKPVTDRISGEDSEAEAKAS